MRLEGWHLGFIILVVLIIWGAPKLPTFAKSLGEFAERVFAMFALFHDRSPEKASELVADHRRS
jgi:Sec-independent protein translocase protein TatA